jgi:GTP-binding protein
MSRFTNIFNKRNFCELIKSSESVSITKNKRTKKINWTFNLSKENTKLPEVKKETTPILQNNTPNNIFQPTQFKNDFLNFSYRNSANYNNTMQSKGDALFVRTKIKLVHYLDDRNINDFRKGITENDYEFYDLYRDVPEFLFLGRSNVGKSSLLNALFERDLANENKKPGKTQRLEFYLFGREGKALNKIHSKSIYSKLNTERMNPNGIMIDAPGFGYVDGPVQLRKKFKYLIYTYLNFAVRLKQIIYLINGEYGMTDIDKEELQFLNNFNKDIQLVFTKVDNFNNKEVIKYLTEASQFTRNLKNVRTEILLTSSRTGYGLSNLRTHLYLDIKEIEDRKNEAIQIEENKNIQQIEEEKNKDVVINNII